MHKVVIAQQVIRASTILIVDDFETDRTVLQSLCNKAGFTHVMQASNGQEALDMIRASPPDLVFLDIEMPVMGGLEVCKRLRDEALLEDMIVMMQTASDKPEVKAQAFALGATDLITKPLEPRETVARMLAHLERRYFRKQHMDDYKRLREELEEAVMLQNILQPSDTLIAAIKHDMQLDIAHYYHPASEMAGDYLAVRRLGDHRVALISVDISGHGLTAALYAFSVHTLIEDAMLATHSPAQILSILNDKLHSFLRVGKFATAFIAIIDTQHHHIDYAAAASPPPIFIASGAARLLETRGHLLGVESGVHYEDQRLAYSKGDLLYIYSDALVESINPQGKTMKIEEVVAILRAAPQQDAAAHIRTIIAAFYNNYTREPADDLSMIACKL